MNVSNEYLNDQRGTFILHPKLFASTMVRSGLTGVAGQGSTFYLSLPVYE